MLPLRQIDHFLKNKKELLGGLIIIKLPGYYPRDCWHIVWAHKNKGITNPPHSFIAFLWNLSDSGIKPGVIIGRDGRPWIVAGKPASSTQYELS